MTPNQDLDITTSNQTHTTLSFDVSSFVQSILTLKSITQGTFDINFIDNHTIHQMNKTHLDHDYTTDILTFNLENTGMPIIGDIYISLEQAAINAPDYHHTFTEEVQLLIIHGILHLLGYDDQSPDTYEVMHTEQNRLLQLIQEKEKKGKEI
tara:strand:- start:283 stop:738 length:456 start_codon:yes stop_codon:yes gene_type:complete